MQMDEFIEKGSNFDHKCSVDASNILLHELVEGSKE